MSRECCNICLRAKIACVCHLFVQIENKVHVVVLQHPNEVKQAKGTVTLLANSLSNCEVIVGENFQSDELFNRILARYKNAIALLYPSEEALVLTPNLLTEQVTPKASSINAMVEIPQCIILLDGTWKKSYKMYQLNQGLHHIPHLTLPDNLVGNYRIRSTRKAQALSSLEACTYALSLLENDTSKYQTLLNSFDQFNDFQLSFNKN